MNRYAFSSDPAWVTVGEGLSLGFRHWRSTAGTWVLPVLLTAVAAGALGWFTMEAIRTVPPEAMLTEAYEIDWAALFSQVLPIVAVEFVVLTVIGMVAQWVFLALAIGGLRGRELDAGWVVDRGLRVFAAGLLFLVLGGAVVALVVMLALRGGPGGVLVMFLIAGLPLLWLSLRLSFWSIAIFDGAGIADAFRVSWRLSDGAVGRIFGWNLAVIGLLLLVSILPAIAMIPLDDPSPIRAAVDGGVSAAFSVFQLFVLAVLYESQRRRSMPDVEPRPMPSSRPWSPPAEPMGWGAPFDAAPADLDGPPLPPPPPGRIPQDPWHPWRG